MTKEVINIHISEVLERIESVDRLINMYRKSADDVVAISMAKQHSIRKEEFVERLNQLRKKALKLEQTPVLKRTYSFEPLLASVAREGERPYGKKDNLTLISTFSFFKHLTYFIYHFFYFTFLQSIVNFFYFPLFIYQRPELRM